MIGIYVSRVIVHFIGKFLFFYLKQENYPRFKKFMNKVSKNLYFGQIIAISIEAYLEFLWMGYLGLKYSGFKNDGDKVSFILSLLLEFISLVLLPISFFNLLFKKKIEL